MCVSRGTAKKLCWKEFLGWNLVVYTNNIQKFIYLKAHTKNTWNFSLISLDMRTFELHVIRIAKNRMVFPATFHVPCNLLRFYLHVEKCHWSRWIKAKWKMKRETCAIHAQHNFLNKRSDSNIGIQVATKQSMSITNQKPENPPATVNHKGCTLRRHRRKCHKTAWSVARAKEGSPVILWIPGWFESVSVGNFFPTERRSEFSLKKVTGKFKQCRFFFANIAQLDDFKM